VAKNIEEGVKKKKNTTKVGYGTLNKVNQTVIFLPSTNCDDYPS
jgi:hypothetical protein